MFYPLLWLSALGPTGETIDEVAECVVFCRLYLVLRAAYIHSDSYVFRTQIARSNVELQQSGYQVNAYTTFKIVFYRHPGSMLLFLTGSIIAVFGFCIFVVERNNSPDLTELQNCYWFVWVTVSTIGYGEITAVSTTGRILVILMSTVMLFVMVLFAGVVTNLLSPTREQKYIQRYLEQSEAEVAYRKAAVQMVEAAWLERRKRGLHRGFTHRSFELRRSPALYDAIRRMRRARQNVRQAIGAAGDSVVDDKLKDIILFAESVNRSLHEQGLAILFLQNRVQRATAVVKQSLSTARAERGGGLALERFEKDPATKRYPYSKFIAVH